jgi:hypothetical protein
MIELDYTKLLEEQNEHLKHKLAISEKENELFGRFKWVVYEGQCQPVELSRITYQYENKLYSLASIHQIINKDKTENITVITKFNNIYPTEEIRDYGSVAFAKQYVESNVKKILEYAHVR